MNYAYCSGVFVTSEHTVVPNFVKKGSILHGKRARGGLATPTFAEATPH